MVGNPFSVAYGQNTHMAGIMFMTWKPIRELSLTYNNFFGNQALKNAKIEDNILYNNIIVTYNPIKHLEFVGQFDFGEQSNSGKPPDTTSVATVYSGFLQAKYAFNEHFSFTGRYETFNDPQGFLSGVNPLTNRGQRTRGFALSFEYRPVSFGYVRVSYRYLHGYPGSHDFHSNTSDVLQTLTFTTAVRF